MKVRKLWSWLPMAGITIFGSIFVKNLANGVLIAHERVHERQQREHPWRFWFGYIFWPPTRARLEAEAYAVEAGAGYPIGGDNGLAAKLSGYLYLWCCSRGKAAALIESYRLAAKESRK